jgi:hypothetical protein
MVMRLLNFIIISTLFVSCAEKKENISSQYYDIKGLFTKQIGELTKQKSVFRKEIIINNEKEIKDLSIISWPKELEPFVKSDINKPALANNYTVIETDSTISYLLKNELKAPIYSVKINRKNDQIGFIEIKSTTSNLLYDSKTTLIAKFEKGIVQKYSVRGEQKILIFNKENYQITGQRL